MHVAMPMTKNQIGIVTYKDFRIFGYVADANKAARRNMQEMNHSNVPCPFSQDVGGINIKRIQNKLGINM